MANINGVSYSSQYRRQFADNKVKNKDVEHTDNKAEDAKKEEKAITGLFTEDQLKFLDSIKDDPDNKRLIDNQAMGKEQFMHILLKQLANQNPLDPMQDKDFIAQMAQFSSLESMQNMSANFKVLAEDVSLIKSMIGQPGAVDVEYITYLKELHKCIMAIGKKLGVEFDEKPVTDGVNTSENAGQSSEAETGASEAAAGAGSGRSADASAKDANDEIKAQSAKKAAKEAYTI